MKEAAGRLTTTQHDLFPHTLTAREIKTPSRGYPTFAINPPLTE